MLFHLLRKGITCPSYYIVSRENLWNDSFLPLKECVKLYFGDDRDSSLADMIQTTLMLAYNGRDTGHAERTLASFCVRCTLQYPISYEIG